MDMKTGMSDCPFMSHEEVICPMNLVDHIGAWKSSFFSAVPALTLLLAIAGTMVLLASVAPNLLRRIRCAPPLLVKWIQERTYTFCLRPLQELFSQGILNPKVH